MNINSDENGLPDVEALQKLANGLFKALPGDYSALHTIKPEDLFKTGEVEPVFPQSESFNINSPQTSLPDPQSDNRTKLPASVAGSGISPSYVQQVDAFNLNDPQTSLPDPHFNNNSKIPSSLGGSGISPSYTHKENIFNIDNPQTSLPDPHFDNNNKVPASLGGSGISPSQLQPVNDMGQNGLPTNTISPALDNGGKQLPSASGLGITEANMLKGYPFANVPFVQHLPPDTDPTNKFPFTDPSKFNSQLPVDGLTLYKNPAQLPGTDKLPLNHAQNNLNAPLPDITGKDKEWSTLGGMGFTPDGLDKGYNFGNIPFLEHTPVSSDPTRTMPFTNPMDVKGQIPFTSLSGLSDPSFYFLTEKQSPPFGTEYKLPSDKAVTTSSIGQYTTFTRPPFDVNLVKKDFPILNKWVNGKPLIWLDNAATTQKPKQVIDRISYFYENENSNIHRAAHDLAARATDAYEGARKKVQGFLNAGSVNEIVFVRGATEAINLVAKSWGEQFLNTGDEIIISHLEHHANIVPWQQLAAKKGLVVRVIPVDDDGQVILGEYAKLLGPKTKLVSFTQVSNALGTVTPTKTIVEMAHHVGARVLVDGAQSVSHMRVDVRELNCDWFVFSGHKVFAPTGIGVVYGKEELLNETQPWQGGGNMIVDVTFEKTTYHQAPGRFEAGTGNIADAVGLGAAIDYVQRIGMDLIHQYEHYLLQYATRLMKEVPGLRLVGTAREKASVLSFVLDGYKTEEVGAALNQNGIAVRSGHHCAQPILRRFGLESTVRPSLAFYNTCSDVDALVTVLHRLKSGQKK